MPEGQEPQKINDVMPGHTIQPSADPMPPPQPMPPADVDPENIPKFGELQPKVDEHPLFSGTKDPTPKKKSLLRKTLWPVLALLLAGILLYLAVDSGLVKGYSHLPFHFFQAPVTATAPAITPAKTATTTTPITTDPYAGWKTYTGTSFNFKYPADWNAKAGNFGQDNAVWGTAVYINPNTVPTNIGAFVNPPASYSKTNSYTVTIKEFSISTSQYLSYSGGIGYNQPTPYNYLKTSGQVSSGLFKGKYLTFLSQLNVIKNIPNKLPTQGLVTNQVYDGSNGAMSEQGFVVVNGKTYQITVDSTDDSTGNGYPSILNMSAYTGTDLYKDTVLVLQSFN